MQFSLRNIITYTFVFAAILIAAVSLVLQYSDTKEIVINHTLNEYNNSATLISKQLATMNRDAKDNTRIIAHFAALTRQVEPKKLIPFFKQILVQNPSFYQIYIGDVDSNFVFSNLKSSNSMKHNAPIGAEWKSILRITNEQPYQVTTYYNKEMNPIKKDRSSIDAMDVRNRSWFAKANTSKVFASLPYLFVPSQLPGVSYSLEVGNREKKTVIGIDILLNKATEILKSQNISNGAEAYIFTGNTLITSNVDEDKQLNSSSFKKVKQIGLSDDEKAFLDNHKTITISNTDDWAPFDFVISGKPKGFNVDYIKVLSKLLGVKFEFINGRTWSELRRLFNNGHIDMLNAVVDIPNVKNGRIKGAVYSNPITPLEFGIISRKEKSYRSLKDLDDNSMQVKHKKLGLIKGTVTYDLLKKSYPNINIEMFPNSDLALNALMMGEIDAYFDSLRVLHVTQKQLNFDSLITSKVEIPGLSNIQVRMAALKDNKILIDIINKAIANVPNDIYQSLHNKWLTDKSSVFTKAVIPYKQLTERAKKYTQEVNSKNFNKEKLEDLKSYDVNGEETYFYLKQIINNGRGEGIYLGVVEPASTLYFDAMHNLRMSTLYMALVLIVIILPIVTLLGYYLTKSLNLLKDETKKIKLQQYNKVKKIKSYTREFNDLSESIFKLAHQVQAHDAEMDEFIDSFIHVIANAIDDKSPYTAGHCNRVPEIAMLIAEAAENNVSGIFSDFKFNNEQEKREFSIAAWLHDCGKITTPEYIVDKGTKLEAITNRIHEIRTRFEVLWRDAEIRYFKQVLANESQEQKFAQELRLKRQQLQDDFSFIAQSNVGSEFMSDEDIERIHQIAEITWLRYFDDSIGLSPAEELRVGNSNCNVYPIEEKLLMDRPEHRIERIQEFYVDPAFAIKMDVPELQYDLGEIHNLTIRRGTLTAEDRFKINEHMISTIKILEKIPFPKSLANVPKYASTHHETMKGTGYPRKLSAEDLSIPERIIAVADVFEALTAADRPYKKAKPVSVAIDILHKMALDNLLDLAVFKLFLKSGVYKVYADKYLPEEQNDLVDISKYV
ncbi:hypothetical protein UA32_16970 [Photobacterium angustum]|uniref:ABC transporter substrate-binding protein n=1 Tax=Photobacterium angustum TaxID=661 RepID=A0ABX5H8H4_PHOAN|nr:HD domain-containing phosphohydrolase [Photobacterium angustum]KJG36373.1 hypothetical protein UA32_16970 [Photobacterium angustum]PSX12140.1 ABC transporter substrate-binding protein [Photobacterium angustum]